MTAETGWLQRSLDRAHENIMNRPIHLQPRRYRDAGSASPVEAERTPGAAREPRAAEGADHSTGGASA